MNKKCLHQKFSGMMRRCTNFDSCNSEALYQREMYLTFLKTSNLYLYGHSFSRPFTFYVLNTWKAFLKIPSFTIFYLLGLCILFSRGVDQIDLLDSSKKKREKQNNFEYLIMDWIHFLSERFLWLNLTYSKNCLFLKLR